MDTVKIGAFAAEAEEHAEEVEQLENLEAAVGVLCELRNMKNDLVFIGRIQRFDGKALTIYASGGGKVPPVVYNTEFKINIRLPGRPVMVWYGRTCGANNSFWKVDSLAPFTYAEKRSHFRQRVSAPAKALCINSIYYHKPMVQSAYYVRPCHLVDISLGGVQVRSREHYERGDWLLLMEATLVPRETPYVFTCQVCWADRAGPREFIFGCRFASMTEQEQDKLCADIFKLQRMDLQRHRGDE